MNKEKQIEEMAKVMHERAHEIAEDPYGIAKLIAQGKRMPDDFAEVLYSAGYRKASEVAEEIFAEIENDIDGLLKAYVEKREKEWTDTLLVEYISGKIDAYSSIKFRLAEFKKKYMEGKE